MFISVQAQLPYPHDSLIADLPSEMVDSALSVIWICPFVQAQLPYPHDSLIAKKNLAVVKLQGFKNISVFIYLEKLYTKKALLRITIMFTRIIMTDRITL